jgi:hypothetical protein
MLHSIVGGEVDWFYRLGKDGRDSLSLALA